MNERTHFFIKIYLSHFILKRVDVGCVWEVSWRRGQTVTYWPKVLLTIAALLSHLGWGCSTVGHWGPKALRLLLALSLASCSPTDSNSNSNWNWPKPSVAPSHIIVSRSPASAVPPLISTGASLDWWHGWGSIYNSGFKYCYVTLIILINTIHLFAHSSYNLLWNTNILHPGKWF